MRKKNNLVEVFGIDGSGKSTVIKKIKSELNKQGFSVLVVNPLQFYDPFLIDVFSLIQKIKKSKEAFHKKAEAFLSTYFSFAFVNQTLKANSENCDLIIYDRYLSSHLLNQACLGDVSEFQPLFDLLPKPIFSVLIDVPVELAVKRLKKLGEKAENESNLKKARTAHLEFAKKRRIPILDGSASKIEVFNHLMGLLKTKITFKKGLLIDRNEVLF